MGNRVLIFEADEGWRRRGPRWNYLEGEPGLRCRIRFPLAGSHPQGEAISLAHQVALTNIYLPETVLPPALADNKETSFDFQRHGTRGEG